MATRTPDAPRPFTARDVAIGNVVIKAMSALNTWVYRKTKGRLGGKFPGGAPVLLLTTKGRKSGEPRTTPLIYLVDGDRYVLVASKGGMDHHPLWYHNLVAEPAVTVQLGDVRKAMVARPADEAEKARLWPLLCALYPEYQTYQDRTERDIPVVIVSPQ